MDRVSSFGFGFGGGGVRAEWWGKHLCILGWQGQGKRITYVCWWHGAERNESEQILEKLGRGKVNPSQNLFGPRRPRETNPISRYMSTLWGWAKWAPINFRENRLRESKPMSKFVLSQKAKGENPICICWCREAERNEPEQILEKQGRGKVNPSQNLFGPRRPKETNPMCIC